MITPLHLIVILALSLAPAPSDVATVYTGDGLMIRVAEMLESGDVRGELSFKNATYPFTGKHASDPNGTVVVKGTFTAGNDSFEFTATKEAGSESLTFKTGEKTYRLSPANPLDDQGKRSPPPAPQQQTRTPAPQANPNDASPTMRVKLAAFPDVTMGVPIAHMAMIPDDWSARGQIEWNSLNGDQPFPQQKIEITSPQGGRIRFTSSASSSFMSAPGQGQQGDPAPDDFPRWFAASAPKMNAKIRNLQMIDAKRNERLEAMMADADRQTNALTNGMRRECWVITIEYDEESVRRREELAMMYVAYAPFKGINGFFTQSWAIFPGMMVSAPVDRFEADKAMLYRVGSTVRPTPQWFTHSQGIIAEMSRQKMADWAGAIRDRGRRISEMSDAQYAAYRQAYASPSNASGSSGGVNSDASQRTRLNTINETDDFKDVDGKIVNLPIHYKHVFSDGNRYVLTNDYNSKPGESWNEIQPMK